MSQSLWFVEELEFLKFSTKISQRKGCVEHQDTNKDIFEDLLSKCTDSKSRNGYGSEAAGRRPH